MKIFMFLIEIIILALAIWLNVKFFKKSVEEGDNDKVWKWIILLMSFAFIYFMINATYQLIFSV